MTAHFQTMGPHKYVKYYNHLFHLLKAVHTFQIYNVPTIKSVARTRLDRYYTILDCLTRHQANAGGFSVEARMKSTALDDTVLDYWCPQAYGFVSLISPAAVIVRYVTVPGYIRKIREKLSMADSILTRSGITRQRSSGKLLLRQKRIMGDLKSLFGYATHNSIKMDLINPIVWWRHQEDDRALEAEAQVPQAQVPQVPQAERR